MPAARGRGWGLEVVRHAQWLSGQASRNRLILAVDAANEPALRIYAAAGFQSWDQKSVYVLVLDEKDGLETSAKHDLWWKSFSDSRLLLSAERPDPAAC